MPAQLHGLEKTQSLLLTRHVYLVCWFLMTWRLTSMWLLSASSTSLSPSVVRHRIDNNTDPCLCLQLCRRLLQSAHRVTTFSYRQVSVAARVITNTLDPAGGSDPYGTPIRGRAPTLAMDEFPNLFHFPSGSWGAKIFLFNGVYLRYRPYTLIK